MLKTKTMSISAISYTENGKEVASMNCTLLDSNITDSMNVIILDQELYEKNKELVRNDIDEFISICREKEDNGAE